MIRRANVILLAAVLLYGAQAQAQKLKLAVLPVQLDKSAKGKVPQLIDELVLTAVQHVGDFDVVGQDDLNALINFEEQKELLGCDDASCLVNLGGALGVDKIIVLKVARIGTEWVTTSKLLDIVAARVDARSNYFVQGSAKALLQAVPQVVGELFKNVPKSALVPPGTVEEKPAVAEPAEPTPTDPPVEHTEHAETTPTTEVISEPAPEAETPTVTEKKPEKSVSPASTTEVGIAARFEFDALGMGWALGLGGDIILGRIGGSLSVFLASPIGVRGEVRYFVVRGDLVRVFVGGGATLFGTSLGLRPAFGVQLRAGPLLAFLDGGFEYFVTNGDEFESMALTLGAGVGAAF